VRVDQYTTGGIHSYLEEASFLVESVVFDWVSRFVRFLRFPRYSIRHEPDQSTLYNRMQSLWNVDLTNSIDLDGESEHFARFVLLRSTISSIVPLTRAQSFISDTSFKVLQICVDESSGLNRL